MSELEKLLDDFILNSKNILYDNLIGIYLHGSLAMGCYNEKKSDIDLLVVVKNDISKEDKRRYMDMVVALNNKAPSKGIELSIVKNAKEEIIDDTMYIILNLCRVLAYKKERLILSKQEGGEWALHSLSDPQYKKIVLSALEEYKTGNTMSITQADAVRFVEYMLKHITDA